MAERASSSASPDLTAQMLRHNLSLRPVFVKVARQGGAGKGNWCVGSRVDRADRAGGRWI